MHATSFATWWHKQQQHTAAASVHAAQSMRLSLRHENMVAQECVSYKDKAVGGYLVTQCAFHSRNDFAGISRQLQPVLHCSSIQITLDGRGSIVCCLRQRKDWQVSMILSDCPHHLIQA
jgi:hypothetical protein